jgi:putative DNA primase/helicase
MTAAPPIDGLLGRLQGVRTTAAGWDALCPAHDDRRPSLGLAVGDGGKVLVKCRAGCTTEAVLSAIGLTLADLFPAHGHANGKAKLGRIAKTYDYTDADGALLYQVVRFEPKAFRQQRPDGKGGWVWSLNGTPRVPYRLPELLNAPADAWVFVVEGEKDADALAELGLAATTNAQGAGKWHTLEAATVHRAFAGRKVAILPDNDDPGRRHARVVAGRLGGVAAEVRVLELPGLPPKGDVSDWLAAGGTRERLVELAEAGPAVGGGGDTGDDAEPTGQPVESDNDPHRLARVVRQAYASDGGGRLVYWSQQFHQFTGGAYQTIPDPEMRALVNAAVKREADRLNLAALATWAPRKAGDRPPAAMHVSGRLIGDVLQALAGYTLAAGVAAPPAWLGGAGPFPSDELLACRNGLVHLPTLTAGLADYHLPPTPRFFTFTALDYDFSLEATPPTLWLDFLAQLWPDDPASIGALQEWFGYLLLPDTRHQKILMLVGPKRSGKGTIARVLRALVGPANVAGPTLASFGQNFGLWPLLNKSVAVISDARLSGRSDAAVVTERLLSISGEDAITVDRKYLTPITTKLNARLVILTNELPRLNDSSGALAGRLILLRLIRSWYGQEDHVLTDRLLTELPGILLWAIEGWRRLRERGRFVQPESGQQLVADMEDITSPVGAFVRECCWVGPEHEVEIQRLFSRWEQWCDAKGRKEHGSEQMFGRDLRAAVPGVDTRQSRRDGQRVRVYAAIGLRVGDYE